MLLILERVNCVRYHWNRIVQRCDHRYNGNIPKSNRLVHVHCQWIMFMFVIIELSVSNRNQMLRIEIWTWIMDKHWPIIIIRMWTIYIGNTLVPIWLIHRCKSTINQCDDTRSITYLDIIYNSRSVEQIRLVRSINDWFRSRILSNVESCRWQSHIKNEI
jgi:hypothetical protein